jgi:hypothetical protein
MHAASKGCGSACRQKKIQELRLCGLGNRKATEGTRAGAWWAGAVGCKFEWAWCGERALEQKNKLVAREPAEGVVRVTG